MTQATADTTGPLAPDARVPLVWLFGPRFDLAWVFGGALLSLAAIGLTLGLGVPIVAVWWVWLLGFDGPHMMAAYTRTYLAREERARRPLLLWASLGTFALGPAVLFAGAALDRPEPFLLFLGVATVYGYNHVVRQHYGFVALYRTKAGERSRISFYADKWCLYVGCWIPQIWFLVTHPRARTLAGLSETAPVAIQAVLVGLWIASLAVWVGVALRAPVPARNPTKMAYGIGAVLLHGLAYFVVGRFEPVYAASAGPDQDFLLLSVVITIFHNVQYVALVFAHNRSRYRARAARYLAVCLAFSVLYFAVAAMTGVFPGVAWWSAHVVGGVTLGQLALALWWGIALHHYVLDQFIWRIGRDPDLRAHLGLARSATTPSSA